MNTALLKWVLRHPFITTAVPGFQTFQELEEDLSVAYNLDYTAEEKKFLEDRNVKLALGGVCAQCYACTADCPRGVDIPLLMRAHMYAACYANFHESRTTFYRHSGRTWPGSMPFLHPLPGRLRQASGHRPKDRPPEHDLYLSLVHKPGAL